MNEALGEELEKLDDLRNEFQYHIYTDHENPGYICVAGNEHLVIREIVHRLRLKYQELRSSKKFSVRPPAIEGRETDTKLS
jgi:hypothetical protein